MMGLGPLRRPWGLWSWCAGVYVFLYLPMAVMMAFSFNNARRNVVWKGFTFEWYRRLASNHEMLAAFLTSLELAVSAALASLALGVLASYVLVRHPPFRGRKAYTGFINVPMMLPEVVLGVGLLTFFVRANIPLSFPTLVAAHVIFCLPYTTGAIRARLLSLRNANIEEAAMDLGATEWTAFRKVTLPLLRPALLSGGLLAFTMSFEDFVTSFFVAGIGVETLPIRIYSMMKFGITPEVNALATLLLLVTTALLLGQHFLTREKGQR
ncbi:MAG: ABC transporter permease [Elusimicrobia bacterium]|nr:ABC transporter permease [Elusimicrobiota bacterium]